MDKNIADRTLALIDGHVLIRDYDTQEVLLDKHNAINYENFSVAIVSLLSGTVDTGTGAGFEIIQMKFGNGGTVIDATGNVELKTDKSAIQGSELKLSLDNTTGSLENATFSSILKDSNSKFTIVHDLSLIHI